MREIVLDTETTGLNPMDGHRLVEIGCLELHNHMPTGRTFHVYINPEREMPVEAFEVHGLSDEFLANKPLFKDIVEEFLTFIGEDMLVIHNANFDMRFLNHELAKAKYPKLKFSRTLDTLMVAREKFPGSPASLDALCRRFKIDNSNRVRHGALLDAELLADVYLELMGGRQPNLTLVATKHGPQIQSAAKGAKKVFKEPRKFPAPAEELTHHENFMKKVLK